MLPHPRAPETCPKLTRNPRVRVRMQKCTRGSACGRIFSQPRKFAYRQVFTKPTPASADTIPNFE